MIRPLFLLLIALVALNHISAQGDTPVLSNRYQIGKWQLSGGFFLPSSTKVAVSILTPDSARAHRNTFESFPVNQRPSRTAEFDGQEVDYFRDGAVSVAARDVSSWFISSIGLHRQFASGFNVYGRLVYGRQHYTATVRSADELPALDDGFIELRRRQTGFGLQIGVDYHFFRQSRFQPKVGVAYSSVRENTRLESPYNFVIPGQNFQEAIAPPDQLSSDSFRDERIVFNLGLLYRFLPRWSIGIEARDADFFRDGFNALLGLELRYWYGQNP